MFKTSLKLELFHQDVVYHLTCVSCKILPSSDKKQLRFSNILKVDEYKSANV